MPDAACRLLPFAVADGPHNMAADETLMASAAAGVASLRFYGWPEATLSLGYFQAEKLRLCDPRLAGLPFVRRPSGGATLIHHHELTYCLALPVGTRVAAVLPAEGARLLTLKDDLPQIAEEPIPAGR